MSNENIISELITDRTASDVHRAMELSRKGFAAMTDEEREEFLTNMRGAYNFADLNRVEGAVKYLSERLQTLPSELRTLAEALHVMWIDLFEIPYDPSAYSVNTKTDWKMSDFPTSSDERRYFGNVALIKSALVRKSVDMPTSFVGLTYEEANALEEALSMLHVAFEELKNEKETMIENTAKAWFYSGDLLCGEV